MKTISLLLAASAAALSGCVAGGDVGRPAPALEIGPDIRPIRGSITYGGQPRTRLKKAPIGSSVPHDFYNEQGERVYETYIIQPDRSLKLVNRRICRFPFCDD
jgi:hypothetical protein